MLDVQYKVVPSGTSVVLTVTVTLPPSLTLELFATGLAVGVAGVIYLFTGEWEYASLGALLYIGWEAIGYFLHERVWAKFGHKVK